MSFINFGYVAVFFLPPLETPQSLGGDENKVLSAIAVLNLLKVLLCRTSLLSSSMMALMRGLA